MKKHKLIIASYVTLIALAISSIGVTFAWFNYGAQLALGHLDVTFVGEKDLTISMDGINNKNELNYEDLEGTTTFYPVSSMYSSKWIEAKAEKPLFKNGYRRADINHESSYREPQDASTGFFQRELYLHSTYNLKATIDASAVSIIANDKFNDKVAEKLYENNPYKSKEEIKESLGKVATSMRISILDPDPESYSYTIIDPHKNGDTYLCGPMAIKNSSYYDYYDVEGVKKEFVFGEYTDEDKIVYLDESETDSSVNYPDLENNVFNAATKAGVKKFDMKASIENGFKPKIEDSLTPSEAETTIRIPIKANEAKKIIVSLYLEGWDLDNTSDSMFGGFLAGMKFKIGEDY